ncbi:class I SAM-dependent methyltransferase [Candidatus Izemoplasma sp. B36]|uniref:tRNA (mnm(5)s(2)U34)-methyltransferase n=1 Tax=Candidatus Izemoplasma sp. B36 TaxID=3242468 RepID=UPI0035582BE4
MINIVDLSHEILKEFKNPNIAVDMTCGNGFDTLFLSNIANEVYAFDIQDLAIENTSELLKNHHANNVNIIKGSHDLFDKYVKENIDLAIYNLGYLPKGNKAIRTEANIVISSLKKAINKLNENGIIVLVIYLHDMLESNQISDFASRLDSKFDVMRIQVLNKKDSPYIIKINKIKE